MGKEERRWEHWEDLPEEVEKQMIEDMARYVESRDLGLMAQIMLESGAPLSKLFSTIGMGLFGPYLEVISMDRYVAFFRKEGNAKLLLDRIDELEYQRKQREEEKKQLERKLREQEKND